MLKRLFPYAIPVLLAVLAGFLICLPSLYRFHANSRLKHICDKRFGEEGWTVTSMSADNQAHEQIDLYRTLYFKLFYPRLLEYTPYENVQFTHRCGYANAPPHYAVTVFSEEKEIAYRWSIRESDWYVSYENSIRVYPKEEQNKIRRKIANSACTNGLRMCLGE